MGNASARNDVGTAYINDVFMRHPLTTRNQEELEVAARAAGILQWNQLRNVFKRTPRAGASRSTRSGSP